MRLRPIAGHDHADVLALNARNVDLLAPLDEARLLELQAVADYAHVVEVHGVFAGFVLTFMSGAAYDGENFGWFSERYDDFCYLDRVVVHEDLRRRGLGTRLYDVLEEHAARSSPLFTLEVNLDPPNTASLEFHQSRGFEEVGRRDSHGRTVSMMAKTLP